MNLLDIPQKTRSIGDTFSTPFVHAGQKFVLATCNDCKKYECVAESDTPARIVKEIVVEPPFCSVCNNSHYGHHASVIKYNEESKSIDILVDLFFDHVFTCYMSFKCDYDGFFHIPQSVLGKLTFIEIGM